MGLFEHWPYTNFHDLNLDWIIKKIPEVFTASAQAAQSAETAVSAKNDAVAAKESAQLSAENAAASEESAGQSAESAQNYAEHIADPVGGLVTGWLDDNITPTTPPVDASLTVQGAAADAKATGDAIRSVPSIPTEVKQAMDTMFHKMAIINTESESYESEYNTIHNWAYSVRLVSISAVYVQTGNVFETDSLESFKEGLTVTARYNNGTTEEVSNYVLSGELEEGQSVINVTYQNKTASFTVTVKAWTLAWDYTDGDLPAAAAPNDWTATIRSSGAATPTIAFDNGIKFVGRGGSYTITPTNYQNTSVGAMEFIANFKSLPSGGDVNLSVRATLNAATDTLIGYMFKNGVKVNGSTSDYSFIPNTSISLGEDHKLRVERSSSVGNVYLDGALVYSGELRELSGTNNVLISFIENTTAACTVYLKAIRFYHES